MNDSEFSLHLDVFRVGKTFSHKELVSQKLLDSALKIYEKESGEMLEFGISADQIDRIIMRVKLPKNSPQSETFVIKSNQPGLLTVH